MKKDDVLKFLEYGSKIVGPLVALGPLFKKLPESLNPYLYIFYIVGALILAGGIFVWYYRRSLELPEFSVEKITISLFVTSPNGDDCHITKSLTRRANRQLKPANFLIGQFLGDGQPSAKVTVEVVHGDRPASKQTFPLNAAFSSNDITYDHLRHQIDGVIDLVKTGTVVKSTLEMGFQGAFCGQEEKLVSSMIEDAKELEVVITSTRTITAAWAELWYCDFLYQALGTLTVHPGNRISYTRKDLTAGQQIAVRLRFA
ncbi:MAG: hypothetical protein WBW33_09585 [Bryobacteraceae bacterium]